MSKVDYGQDIRNMPLCQLWHDINGNWAIAKPTGGRLSISSTITSGIQEAIDYANQNGYRLAVDGGWIGSQGKPIMSCTGQIKFPARAISRYNFYGCNIWFTGSAATDFIVIETQDQCNLDFGGSQIVHSGVGAGNGATVLIKPTLDNGESFVGVTSSRFNFGVLVAANGLSGIPNGTRGYCLVIDTSGYYPGYAAGSGIIINCGFTAEELNGGINAILIQNPYALNPVRNNRFIFDSIHTQGGTAGIQIGTSAAAADLIFLNKWDVIISEANIGISTWSGHSYNGGDRFEVLGTGNPGMLLNSTARGHLITTPSTRAAFPITNNSNYKSTIRIIQPNDQSVKATIAVGASPFVWQNPYGMDANVITQGGNVSLISYSGDGGVFTNTGQTQGVIKVPPGDFLSWTYTVAPTVTAWYK